MCVRAFVGIPLPLLETASPYPFSRLRRKVAPGSPAALFRGSVARRSTRTPPPAPSGRSPMSTCTPVCASEELRATCPRLKKKKKECCSAAVPPSVGFDLGSAPATSLCHQCLSIGEGFPTGNETFVHHSGPHSVSPPKKFTLRFRWGFTASCRTGNNTAVCLQECISSGTVLSRD